MEALPTVLESSLRRLGSSGGMACAFDPSALRGGKEGGGSGFLLGMVIGVERRLSGGGKGCPIGGSGWPRPIGCSGVPTRSSVDLGLFMFFCSLLRVSTLHPHFLAAAAVAPSAGNDWRLSEGVEGRIVAWLAPLPKIEMADLEITLVGDGGIDSWLAFVVEG